MIKREITSVALTAFAAVVFIVLSPRLTSAAELADGFVHPPGSARPWVYWFWLNGNITSNGITADLEAMQRVGIGGVLIMEVNQGTPKGDADFGGHQWRELFKHVCNEAHRLGLEVNMNNDAGWCGSGGPWIPPALAMQKLVWTETNLAGTCHFEGTLAHPETISNYYADIAVLAFPTPPKPAQIENIKAKAAFVPERVPPIANFACLSSKATIPRHQILDLTARLGANGSFKWDPPPGAWTVLRLGHTPTGKDNHPAPEGGRGLESDKLSRAATDAMFAGLMGNRIADSKPLAGKTLVSTHIDSWETGSQNWTPRFRQEFNALRGYDLLPFLPVITGRVVESLEMSERFLWDLRQTVSDLLIRNYAGRFRELAHKNGLRLSIEAYDHVPCDEMTYAGQADEPMAEFWSWGASLAWSCTEMSSAAHVYGKRILGAEAFTASDGEKWQHHPASIKALGDWAFCEGINRFVFHRYALQPWSNVQPGMSMGPWGLHYERTQTWWEQSTAWHQYLARCQFLLQQGLFVADICYLQPEGSPQRFRLAPPGSSEKWPDRPKYNFDGCTPEVVLNRMKVSDGRLVLPDGMSYRMLVLPDVETMTPVLLRKIRDLVRAGATVVGSLPTKSPSLVDYPGCDVEVKKLAEQLWGQNPLVENYTERSFGKGRVISGGDFRAPKPKAVEPNPLAHAKWIWAPEGKPQVSAPIGKRYFRRVLDLGTNQCIALARLALTADNSFEAWVNGQRAGDGADFNDVFKLDVLRLLKPGTNLVTIAAENGGEKPNPAGLIAALEVQFANGTQLQFQSDREWESASAASQSEAGASSWASQLDSTNEWKPVMELGAWDMAPWALSGKPSDPLYHYPDANALAATLAAMGVPPDFESDAHLRYIHRRTSEADIYFVANPGSNWVGAQCAFRVTGESPEIWCPVTGAIKKQLVYRESDGRTFLPLWLEPAGSILVVFERSPLPNGPSSPASAFPSIIAMKRNGLSVLPEPGQTATNPPAIELACLALEPRHSTSGPRRSLEVLAWQSGTYEWRTSDGKTGKAKIDSLPQPLPLNGSWEVCFQTNRGAPERVMFDSLMDWSRHTNAGVKYFSGTATYLKQFNVPKEYLVPGQHLSLDLGSVAVIARVTLNGKDLGILWTPPFQADVTGALQPGENQLEIQVVNLWPNRMIGDEQLPEDSVRKKDGTLEAWPAWLQAREPSPACRLTFTTWRLWKKDSQLQPSGLLGPVRLIVGEALHLDTGTRTGISSLRWYRPNPERKRASF
jgi:hypothetical protein